MASNKFTCDTCKKIFKTRSLLDTHDCNDFLFFCESCDLKTPFKQVLERHIKSCKGRDTAKRFISRIERLEAVLEESKRTHETDVQTLETFREENAKLKIENATTKSELKRKSATNKTLKKRVAFLEGKMEGLTEVADAAERYESEKFIPLKKANNHRSTPPPKKSALPIPEEHDSD